MSISIEPDPLMPQITQSCVEKEAVIQGLVKQLQECRATQLRQDKLVIEGQGAFAMRVWIN